jgi:hypothetical protein
VWLHSMARHSVQRRRTSSFHDWFFPPKGGVKNHYSTSFMGWTFMGPHILLSRLHRKILLPNRGLFRHWCSSSGYVSRVQDWRLWRDGLFWCQPCRWVQLAIACCPPGRFWSELYKHWMRGGFEWRVSFGA